MCVLPQNVFCSFSTVGVCFRLCGGSAVPGSPAASGLSPASLPAPVNAGRRREAECPQPVRAAPQPLPGGSRFVCAPAPRAASTAPAGGVTGGAARPLSPPGPRRARCRPPPAPRRAGGWNRGCPPSPSTARPPPAPWSPSR